jgi:two-component system, chemotaxis family, chemotaxis protein CheY
VPGKILVVEDREMISQALSDMLTLSGYSVVGVAEDGKSAIQEFKERSPDVVLLDLLLPDMNGIDVARELLKIDGSAKLVAITAATKEGIMDDCRRAGIRYFIRKPFRMKELLSTIEEVLSSK